jgi:uncharacterized protein YgiM (DUF1202 family)
LTVTVDTGRIREEPSLGSRVLFRVQRGDVLNVMAEEVDWIRIALKDGRSGWAHRSLFTEAPPSGTTPPDREGEKRKALVVRVDVARVREEPSRASRIIHQLKRGETVSSSQSMNDWHHLVLPNGKSGWAHKDLFSQNG